MKTNSYRKGNFSYYLNYDENERIYSFVVYVKIRSSKRKAKLNSTRAKDVEISFENIEDDVLKKLPDEYVSVIKQLIVDIEK